MRDMPRVYQPTAEQETYEALGYDEAADWFYDRQNLDRDDPAFEDEFDRMFELAIKNRDVMVADSIGGRCQVGINRTPGMHMEEVSQLRQALGAKKGKESSFMLSTPFIDERKVESDELQKIRAMTTSDRNVEFLKELFPDVVETNWLGLLDDCWLFD